MIPPPFPTSTCATTYCPRCGITTLNNLIGQTYGSRYAVLSESDINDLTSAFTSYEAAYKNNTSTDLAQSNMQLCMDRIKELLNSRYSQGVLKAGR